MTHFDSIIKILTFTTKNFNKSCLYNQNLTLNIQNFYFKTKF